MDIENLREELWEIATLGLEYEISYYNGDFNDRKEIRRKCAEKVEEIVSLFISLQKESER